MKQMNRRIFGTLLIGCMITSCTPYAFTSATGPASLSTATIISKINEVRKAHGRKPVAYNTKLAAAARSQAQLMASKDQLSHNLGVTLRERVTKAGYIGAVGENVAGGHKTLEAAIEGWLASPTHRGTLLSPKFTEFGLAHARVSPGRKSRYVNYWALIMGGDTAAWLATPD